MTRFLKFLLTSFALLAPVTAGASPPRSVRWFEPIMELPKPVIASFRCIIWAESRSTFEHPNLGDNNPYGSSGIFQIEQITWAAHQAVAGVARSIHVWQATAYEQARVAAAIWRADGLAPWASDGCTT